MTDLVSRVAVAVDAPQHSGAARAARLPSERALAPGTLVRVPLGRREVPAWSGPAAPQRRCRRRQLRAGGAGARRAAAAVAPHGASWSAFAAALLPAQRRRGGAGGAAAANCASSTTTQLAHARRAAAKHAGRRRRRAGAAPLPQLNAEQAAALAATRRRRTAGAVALLHGVTGSGKTEVYLRAAARALDARPPGAGAGARDQPDAAARSALRRALRRAALVVSLHSGLTPGAAAARTGCWRTWARADLVLGTRLAVFASLPRLGLIVVDEEHDPSLQAAGRRALLGARPGGLPRPARRRAGAAGLGHAVAGKLAARAERAATARLALPHAHRRRRAAAGAHGRHEPLPRSRRRAARRCRRRCWRRCASASSAASRAWCSSTAAAMRRCCTARDCGWKSGCPHCSAWRVFHKRRPHAALPPLRLHRARAARLPGLRQPRHRSRSAAAPSAWRSSWPLALPRGARRAHRRRHHARARARCRRSWRACMPARWTSWSARRWSPRATTSGASRWWPR